MLECKVMDVLGFTEIPKQLILNRWTRDARDGLPPHLQVYQRDQAGNRTMTHLQTALYIHAMALVRLGDASVAAYERGMKIIKDIISSLAEFDEQRDGLALEDRPSGGDSAAVVTADNGAGDENREEAESRTTEDQQRQSSIRRTEQMTQFCSICICKGHKRGPLALGEAICQKQPRKEAKCSNCRVGGRRKNTH